MPPNFLPILIGAAIVDSINPCAFGVLIFLLAYLAKTVNKPHKLLTHGLTYIFAVFITYLIAGLVLLPIIQGLGAISVTAYVVIGLLIILAGLIELKDFFWYGKGISLALIPGASARIKLYSNKMSASLPGAFGLGVFVALVELPCTGAVYLAILSILALAGISFGAVTFLVLYNFIFVAPLVIILLLVYRGVESNKLELWRKKHRHLMRALIGLMLIGLGAWMIWFALV